MHCSCDACMRAHSSPSIERRPRFSSLNRSWIWIPAFRMAFSSSLEFGYVVLGLFFPFPNSLSTWQVWQVRLRCLTAAGTNRRSHSPLPQGTHVEHSFRKARQLWTLSELPSPCGYFEKRRKHQQQGKSFSAPNRQSQSVLFILPAGSACDCHSHFVSWTCYSYMCLDIVEVFSRDILAIRTLCYLLFTLFSLSDKRHKSQMPRLLRILILSARPASLQTRCRTPLPLDHRSTIPLARATELLTCTVSGFLLQSLKHLAGMLWQSLAYIDDSVAKRFKNSNGCKETGRTRLFF